MSRRYRGAALTIVAACGAAAFANIAFAQATGAASSGRSEFDYAPIIAALINQAFTLVVAVGTYLINAKIENQQMRDLLGKALVSAVGVAKGKAQDALKSSPDRVVTTGNVEVDAGVQYVINNAAEAISHFDLSKEKIAEKIIARIGLLDAGAKLPLNDIELRPN